MHYDTHGTLALSGIKHYDGLGETPPNFSDKDKEGVRKSYYYLYTMATMAPVFQKQAGISTAVGAAGIISAFFTGGLSLIATGVAGVAGLAMAAGTENCVMETTAWWTKSRKARDEYIARAMVGSDIKEMLQKAARRMDSVVANVKSRRARSAARARAYFLDFIAVGPQKNLKSQLNEGQQAAFGAAFLDCLAKKKKVAECMVAGANAATVLANNQRKNERLRGAVAVARARSQAAKAAAMAAAKAKAKAEAELKAQQAKLPPGGLTAAPSGLRNMVMQAQVQVQTTTAAAQQAEAAVVSADQAVSQVVAQQQQEIVASAPVEAAAVAEQASAEDAAVEAANPQAAAAETVAVAAGASPETAAAAGDAVAAGAAPDAAAAAAVAQTATGAATGEGGEDKGGFPIVPALAVAGIAAFLLMRKK